MEAERWTSLSLLLSFASLALSVSNFMSVAFKGSPGFKNNWAIQKNDVSVGRCTAAHKLFFV